MRRFRDRALSALGIASIATLLLGVLLSLAGYAPPAYADFNNATPRGAFAGKHNYTVTGGTLRTQSNNGNSCAVTNSDTATLSGVPSGSTILAAYLYWGGSGAVDSQVTFNGNSITADATFTDFYTEDGADEQYFAGFEDVTAYVTGNGNYTFSNLTVATGNNDGGNPNADYCNFSVVFAGWSLVVVYGSAAEEYRYTRVYDGLKYFRGSSVTTTQTGFRVPNLLDGKVTVVTFEGDPDTDTSYELDGFNETLTFDGHPLSNTGCDVTDNLYNSTIGTSGTCDNAAYGIDIDSYEVTSFLYEGQTGATLEYSSGNDMVFLAAQVISTTNSPVADLGITKTHNGSYFTVGQNGSYNIGVHNYGPEIATGTATVTDTLPVGLTYVSGTGTGWTCSAVGQAVTCNNSQTTLAIGADLPALTLTVAVGGEAAASTDNTATVSHPMFDGTGGNQTDDDTVEVRGSNLSTSTKSVVDLNGGEVDPGDVLEYTITLNETGAFGIDATGVAVVDDLAANLDNLAIVSIPAGAIDNSIGTGGANGTGQVNITGITVPTGTNATIVFQATIVGDADPGDTVDNSVTITNTSGLGDMAAAPTLTVAASEAPISGGKYLYLRNDGTFTSRLSRTRPAANGNTVTIAEDNDYDDWDMNPAVPNGKTLVVPTSVSGNIVMAATNSRTNRARVVTIQLRTNNGTVLAQDNNSVVNGANDYTYNFDLSSQSLATRTLAPGGYLVLRIQNTEDSNNREIQVYQCSSGGWDAADCSYLTFTTPTVINVDDVSMYTAAYPSTATKTTPWEPGETVYVRAIVSDPFGDYDISNATVQLTDGIGNAVTVTGWGVKTETPSDDPAIKIYEGAYTIPASPNYGTFTASVTATEGVETAPTITHTRSGTFAVAPKALNVVKSHSGDFTAGANNAYTLTVNNTGGTTVTGTTTVKDTLATGLTFVSGTGTGWSCSAAGQLVTCTSGASIPASSSMSPITLTVTVAGNMGSSVSNQASVGNSTIAGGYQKPGNTDTAIIRHPDLSSSSKSVQDLNGGDANPGDTLRYTITVIENAGYPANNVTVSDTLPFGLTGLTGLNTSLSTCNGTPSVSSGTLTVTGLSLAGGANCTLVFDVQVSASAGTGLVIDNTATITNPNGTGASPNAAITVAQSQVSNPGDKVLYVYANNTMTRVAQAAGGNNTINENAYQDFVLPGVSSAFTITPGSTINVYAWLRRSGSTTTTARTVYAKLFKNGSTQVGSISGTVNFNSTTTARQLFTITAPSFGSAGNLVPGDTLTLRLYNSSGSGGNDRTVRFDQLMTGTADTDDSRVTISTPTVVNVSSVDVYSAVYPATTQASAYGQGDTIYVRATVTDPFGFADISGGSITIKDAGGTTVHTASLVNATHTVGTPAGATRIYEYPYTIPASPATGAWTAFVTANEGAEGTITDTGNGAFTIGGTVTLRKTWGAGANASDQVTLTIGGGTNAVAGSSAPPSTLTPATANASAGATITLSETFDSGSANIYTVTLVCTKDGDGTTITPVGTGLSRTITMPAGSVTCTFTNSLTVPLSIVKFATTYSDPLNGTTNPKAIPGALVTYLLIVIAPADTQADIDSVVITDPIPANTDLFVNDLPDQAGPPDPAPVAFLASNSTLTFTFNNLADMSDDVAFSNDGGATWTYVPTPDADGVDAAVTNIRLHPKGTFAPGGNVWLGFRVRIE